MDPCRHRVIVLGASNVARSLHLVVKSACRAWGGPLDVLAAIGHGRSFGTSSSVLGRTLPGILQCDLWDEWRSREPLPTAALVTDIGNDILFGATPECIVGWARQCFERLIPRCQRVIVTELPLASLATMGPTRFTFLRTVLFPRSRIQWRQARELAVELNTRVVDLATGFGAAVVKPMPAWYGFDPIHIQRRHGPAAWRYILASWRKGEFSTGEFSEEEVSPGELSRGEAISGDTVRHGPSEWREAVRAWLWRPKYRKLLGVEQTCRQPAGFLSDGTAVSLY